MNLNQFLRRVDSLTEKLSKEGIGSKASLKQSCRLGGGRLPQFEEFLEEWTEYLGKQDGKLAGMRKCFRLAFRPFGPSGRTMRPEAELPCRWRSTP